MIMWYVFNKDKTCIATCSIKPNIEDLATREEYALECEDDSLGLNAEDIKKKEFQKKSCFNNPFSLVFLPSSSHFTICFF